MKVSAVGFYFLRRLKAWVGLWLLMVLISLGCELSRISPLVVQDPDVTASLQSEISPDIAVSEIVFPSTPSPVPVTVTPSASPSPLPSLTSAFWTPIPEAVAGPIVIGYSVNGLPLEVWRFGRGPHQRMIVAGIHGGYEWNTVALADELIAYLQALPELVPADKTLFILRNLNPDGEARDHGPDGRANARGVDLNRNFPVNWQKDWRRSGCWQLRPITAGEAPASEPETQALMAFIQANPLEALLSYHSAGLGIFPAGSPPDPLSVSLAEALAAVSGYPYPPKDTGCTYTGLMVNWVAAQGAAAVDLELSNHYDTDFQTNLAVLSVFLSWEP